MAKYPTKCQGCKKFFWVEGSVKIGAQMEHICGFKGKIAINDKDFGFELIERD